MIIKKYIVNNMNEALTRIRYELGKNAIIINQRKIRKNGFFGFFSHKVLEVTAAIENENTSEDNHTEGSIQEFKKAIEDTKKTSETKVQQNIDVLRKKSKEIIKNSENEEKGKLFKEVVEMKAMLNNIITTGTKNENKTALEKILENVDVEPDIIKKIVSRIKDSEQQGTDIEKAPKIINDMIQVNKVNTDKVLVLVGPTGVGKTTTIAKLAGRYALIENKKTGLITVDTYRIGAIEQLRTYADIMNIPFRVVMTIKEMETAVDSMKDCDVILIDTTGRSSKNAMQISELRAFVNKTNSENIHLVISCTTKNKDIDIIINGYKQLNYKNVIITKLDETSTYGSILNIVEKSKVPISFVTVGQSVPDDIKIMSSEQLVNLILGEDFVC